MRAITLAIVKVLPEPVTPSRVWKLRPSFDAFDQLVDRRGWSPAGGYGWKSWNGESGKLTNSPASGGRG